MQIIQSRKAASLSCEKFSLSKVSQTVIRKKIKTTIIKMKKDVERKEK